MSDSDARPRYAAHRRVLSRVDSSAIGAPCVLALHSPIAPARRASFWFGLLGAACALDARPEVVARGDVAAGHVPLRDAAGRERVRDEAALPLALLHPTV